MQISNYLAWQKRGKYANLIWSSADPEILIIRGCCIRNFYVDDPCERRSLSAKSQEFIHCISAGFSFNIDAAIGFVLHKTPDAKQISLLLRVVTKPNALYTAINGDCFVVFHTSKLVNDGHVLKKNSPITSVFCTFESVNACVMIITCQDKCIPYFLNNEKASSIYVFIRYDGRLRPGAGW